MPYEVGYLIRLSNTGEECERIAVSNEDHFIGSGNACQIKIFGDDTPAKYCVIKTINNLTSVHNLNLRNPVSVNNEAVLEVDRIIQNGDELLILDQVFRWNYVEKPRCFRSLPAEHSVVAQPVERYSLPSGCLKSTDNEDNSEMKQPESTSSNDEVKIKQFENSTSLDIQSVEEIPTATPEPLVKRPYISTSCKIDRSSLGRENKAERLTQTSVKSRTSRTILSKESVNMKKSSDVKLGKKPHTLKTPTKKVNNTPCKSMNTPPFSVSNTFINESKKGITSFCKDSKVESECNVKSILEGTSDEDIISNQPASQPYHSTPNPSASKKSVDAKSSLSSSVDFDFEISQDDLSKLKATSFTVSRNADETVEQNVRSEHNTNVNLSNTTPVKSMKSRISAKNVCSRDFTPKKASSEISRQDSSNLHISTSKIEEGKGDTMSKSANVSALKKSSECLNESRRNTRGRTSILRKTFEEKAHQDNTLNKEKSLTTPEKSIETSKTATLNVESVTESSVNLKAQPSLNGESSKCEFASVSDENDTCENSFIDKYKICNYLNISNGSSATVAKCARNLSYFSPPENNRSQEYMDSIASTPKKVLSPSTHDNNDSYNVSLSSFVSPSKDSSLNESILSPLSSARKRRSTGFVPFVGTPSNVYRVNRKISTPFSKSRLDRTSADFESVEQSSRGAKWSSERRSTPFKVATRKSSMRDSILMHSTIEENELSKDDEDESMNDPKFKYVTTRRQRRCVESSFASENFILEESESKNDDTDSVLAATTAEEEEENDDGDDEDIETFDDVNSETPMSMRITVNNMSTLENSVDVSKLDKTPLLGSKKVAELKSILTPLPKLPCSVVKKSAKKVTFELPDSPASLNLKENTFDCEEAESVLMQSTNEINSSQEGTEQEITNDEETENVENDVSCDSFSYTENPEEISASQSDDEKQEKSSLNETVSLNTTCSSEVNVSGVERIESPNRSKVLHDHEVSIASVNDATVWKGQVNMPDVGTFDTVLSKVSGDCEHLTGLRSNIECVGRVNPNTVWENLRAIKENENMAVSVLRFESPQPDQIDNYMTLFDDLYAKDRLAVISDVGDGIENFYIMALPCHTSMPDILLSNDAASELVYETDSLLAIIVRNYNVKDTPSLPSASASVSNEKSVDKLLESTKQDLSESTNEVFIEAKQNESPDLRDAESMITSPRYASSVCLSGIKSLLTTPIETPDCKITKNKATNKMDENDDEMISSANTFSPEACLSGVKSLLKTPEISQSSAIKAGKRILNFEPDSPKSVVDVVPSPGPIRKSMPNCPQKRTSISRSCKSLGANKNTERKKSVAETEAKLDLEREQPMDIPIIKITEATFVEECHAVESCESETAVDKLVEIESAGRVEESSSGKSSPEQAEMTDKLSQLEDTLVEETDRVENLTNGVLPETTSDGLSHEHAETIDQSSQLVNTRVEEKSSDYQLSEDFGGGSSPKQMEMVNECVESQNIENEEKCSSHQSSEDFSDRLSPQHVQGEQFQTSDHEETLSSEDGVLDRERSVSPVISPRRHRSISKISLLMLANEENKAKNLNVSAFVDVHEETSKLSNLSTEGSSNRTEGSEEITENDLSKRSFDVIAKEGNDTRLLNSPYVNVTKTVVDLKENSTAAGSSLDDEPLEANDFEKTKTPKSSDILNGSESELENTQNSQDIYMKLDVSSDLINDLNEQLGSAYCSSNEPTKPNSPVGPKSHEMFKVPAPVDLTSRLLDVSNMEEINDVTRDVETPGYDTTNTSNHLVNNCSISKSAMNKTCYTPFNKFKTSITSESCSSASPVRRCRKSGRIHSLRVDDSQNLDITDKDCSILSNNSSTRDISENNEDPKQLYRHVVQELSIKTISIKEKLDEQCCLEVSQASDHGNIPRAGESNNVISAESDQQIISDTESANISAIIDADTSSPANPSDQIQSNVSSCNETQITSSQNESNVGEVGSPQPESTVENHQSIVNCENNLEIATPLVQNAGESDSVSRTVLVDEICVVSEASQNEIPPIVIDKLTVPMDENTDVVEKPIPKKKRNLRVRKDEHSSEMENESGNEVGTVTRNRRKRVSETKKLQTSLKPNSKKATERNQIHDDKENVCSLTGVLRKPQSKKMKLSEHENDAMVQSLADKKAKKQLQNVENTVVPEPPIQRSRRIVKKTSPATSHTKRKRSDSPGKNECKKPCSILLPLLDPEIINSPVKVDDAGNITIIKESPELPTKRVRSGRPAKKVAAAVPMEGKQDELAQPTSARVTKQRQTKTVTFDKKSPPTTRRKMAVVKNPVVAEIALSASVAPRVLRKHAEVKKEPETKTKSKRSAKDSCESIEEVVVEPPKRTRGRPKTVTAPESQPICLPENANGRPKRGVKHIVVDVEPEPKNIRKAKSVKKTEAVEEASAGSEASEKNSKNVKINKQLRVLVDDIIQKEDSRRVTRARPANVDPAEETANSTVSSKLISKKAKVIKKSKDAEKSKTASPRITRTKKNEAGTSAKVDNAESNSVSSTSSRSVRKPAQTKRSHEQESDVSVSKKNVTKKPTPSKNIKRVITRSKRLSLTNKKKGRVSLTLNTSSQPLRTQIRKTRASRMVTTAVSAQGNVSSPEVAVTNSRITRKRAK